MYKAIFTVLFVSLVSCLPAKQIDADMVKAYAKDEQERIVKDKNYLNHNGNLDYMQGYVNAMDSILYLIERDRLGHHGFTDARAEIKYLSENVWNNTTPMP